MSRLILFSFVSFLCGCASGQLEVSRGLPAASQPAGDLASVQQGAGIGVGRATGIEYQSELPWKAVAMILGVLALMVAQAVAQSIMSHQREVKRIAQTNFNRL